MLISPPIPQCLQIMSDAMQKNYGYCIKIDMMFFLLQNTAEDHTVVFVRYSFSLFK